MKTFLTGLFFCIAMLCSSRLTLAQAGTGCIAPDFVATDINGNSWHLYDLLDQGKTVFLDIGTTWCPPCWTYHNSGAFNILYNYYGPPGTNEVMVFFIEDDPATTLADLQGTGGNTEGDWVTGTPYPIIDNSSISAGYDFFYYPTIFMITPDRICRDNGTLSASNHYNEMTQYRFAAIPTADAGVDFGCGQNDSLTSCLGVDMDVRLYNYSITPMTSAELSVIVDGGVQQIVNWTGSLLSYHHDIVHIPNVTGIPGIKTADVTVTGVNGGADTRASNDIVSVPFKIYPSQGVSALTQSFSSTSFPPPGWDVINGGNSWWFSWDWTQYGYNSNGAAWLRFFDIASGQRHVMLLPPLNLVGYQSASLNYMRSYKCYSAANNDIVSIQASTDCGATWQVLDFKVGTQLASVPGFNTSGWIPNSPTDWVMDNISLNSLLGYNDVFIKFEGISDEGNNFLLDNINVNFNTGVQEFNENSFRIYPNPVADEVNLQLHTLAIKTDERLYVTIFDVLSAEVFSREIKTQTPETLDVSQLPPGIFYVQVASGDHQWRTKLVKE